MTSRIWRLAAVGLLYVSASAQVLADGPGDGNPQQARPNGGQQRGEQGDRGNNQSRPDRAMPNSGRGEAQGGQWQGRPHQDNVRPASPAQPPGNTLPIQPRPGAVQRSWPGQGNAWQTAPRQPGYHSPWQGAANPRPDAHPRDSRWAGRPSGQGNGWGAGPQYRPGYIVDRFPGQHWQVPYRGQNYFFSGGYWYRPQGPRYIVVQPPYGIRVGYLPDYAREVWVGSTLLFLAAGAYYAYQPGTQDYIVVQPPTPVAQPVQPPVNNGYDVVAWPMNGQSPAQINQDRYDCYRWSVDQSHFDPAHMAYAPAPSVVQAYRQAQGTCLSSRGYQVTY